MPWGLLGPAWGCFVRGVRCSLGRWVRVGAVLFKKLVEEGRWTGAGLGPDGRQLDREHVRAPHGDSHGCLATAFRLIRPSSASHMVRVTPQA